MNGEGAASGLYGFKSHALTKFSLTKNQIKMTDLSKEFEEINSSETVDATQEFVNFLHEDQINNHGMVVHSRMSDIEERFSIAVLSGGAFLAEFTAIEYAYYYRRTQNGTKDERILAAEEKGDDADVEYYEKYVLAVEPIMRKIYMKGYLLRQRPEDLTLSEKEFVRQAYGRYLTTVANETHQKMCAIGQESNPLQSLLSGLAR